MDFWNAHGEDKAIISWVKLEFVPGFGAICFPVFSVLCLQEDP